MGKDFFEESSTVRETFEEANDLLKRDLKKIILEGPKDILTETRNSQAGIYVVSIAFLRVLEKLFPQLKPTVCSGLSLGEYSAVTAAGYLPFAQGLPLVQYRGEYMNDACESRSGTMAVVLGLDADAVEALVKEVDMPHDLWAANFNCPGQVVISGTAKGIEAGTAAAKAKGAKRVLPLQVHGAFHSGLMKDAEERLRPHVEDAPLQASSIELVMNVPGDYVTDIQRIRDNLIQQVTHPVRWEQGIRRMCESGVELFVEIGCGKTLAGFNKRINELIPTVSIEKVADLEQLNAVM